MSRPVNAATVELVKQFEGLRLKAYLCPAGEWTIGYGHTRGVSRGDTITRDEADKFLADDMASAASRVDRLIAVPLNDNQRGALASFVFNLGSGKLASSSLRRRLNAGEYDAVPTELKRWTKARDPRTGALVTLRGLVRRREAEGLLWGTAP